MKRKRQIFGVLAAAMPLLFFVAVEAVLRGVGVAEAQRVPFVPLPGKPDYVAFSPAYAQRYFQAFQPSIAFTPFLRTKAAGSFRVMVLGGSSAAGFPYTFYYGFPARLEARLQALAPGQPIEVVNLGMTAVNSYTLWDLAAAVVDQAPDAVVIYAGHNEYYGAFGAGSSVYALANQGWLKRLTLRLKRLALYLALEQLLAPTPDAPPPGEDRTMMARVVRDAGIAFDGPVYHAGLAQFGANMAEVLATFRAAGIPVYMSTLTANLADQPPLGEAPEAVAAFAEGQALLAAGDTLAARRAFVEARDYDEIRFRAPAAINAQVRQLAEAPGITLVDAEAVFLDRSPQALEGEALFTDHLHPNAEGYALLAEAFADALQSHPALQVVGETAPPVDDRVDPVDAAHAGLQIARLKGGYPFNKTATPAAEAAAFERRLRAAQAAGYADSLAALVATRQVPPPEALLTAARQASSVGDTLAALYLYRALLYWQPFNDRVHNEALALAAPLAAQDALVAEVAQRIARHSEVVTALNLLAAIRLRQGAQEAAGVLLEVVEQRAPTSPVMLFNKARWLVLQGDTLAARRYFERYQAQR